MHGEVVNPLPVNLNRLEKNKRVNIIDVDVAIRVGGDEVSREGEVLRSEEGERGNGGGVVIEGAER